MNNAPVFFISHGAPTFALEPGQLGPRLGAIGQRLSGASAILVVSPHWQTRNVSVMTTARPGTVYDFGGFDPALYKLQYPAEGQPELAAEAVKLLSEAGFAVDTDARRGLDHGAWVPLMHLRPQADLPVFQVSLPAALDTAGAVRLGRALAPLRRRGVVIVGSGSLTHNLYEFRQSASDVAPYAREFAAWTRNVVTEGEIDRLVDYRKLAPHAERAHPTEEHFLPLLVAVGAQATGEVAQVIEGGITHGVLAMDSYVWGLDETQAASAASQAGAVA
jgi:4,5-DOPA dioxygenase extradiol